MRTQLRDAMRTLFATRQVEAPDDCPAPKLVDPYSPGASRDDIAELHSRILALQAELTRYETDAVVQAFQLTATTADLRALEIDTAAMRLARSQDRLFLTDYPYFPGARPIAERAGGKQLIARFRNEHKRYDAAVRGIAQHIGALSRVTRTETVELAPYWENSWFPPFDGAALYGLVAQNRPRRYIEVGSGISTRFARRAIQDLGLSTSIISIDPHPHNAVDGLCDEIVVARAEDLPDDYWSGLSSHDMLFIDNSHRSLPSSDVTVFFTEVLPALPPGLLYGIHDIFLPWDYPQEWSDRFYSEQYLLMTYLLGGGGSDEIVLPVYWAEHQPELHGLLADLWTSEQVAGLKTTGGSFWARRGAAP